MDDTCIVGGDIDTDGEDSVVDGESIRTNDEETDVDEEVIAITAASEIG